MKENWIEIELGKLLDYIQPTKYIVKSTNYDDKYKIPVLTPGKSFIKGYTYETEGIYSDLPAIIFDDFTTSSRFVNFPFKVKSSAMKILKPTSDLVNMKYVFYMMQVLNVRSDTHKRYWISIYSKKQIPFPPLLIQRAIVAKIEQLFSELDNGIQNLQRAKEKLAVFRQAFLKKVFEGDYQKNKLKEIAIVKRGKSKHRPRNDKSLFGGNYPFIQTGEIRAANGGVIKSFQNSYSEKGLAQSKLWPKGTLCLTIAANIGETAFLGIDACFPDSVVGIKPNESLLNDHFLNYYIQKIKKEMDSKASATAQKNINVKFLEELNIPLPSIKNQNQIVQEVDSRFSVCDELEKSIESSLKKAEALRQSILKKAFEGELLTEKEIDQCKQEPDWETAEVLLEKIKKENNFKT